MKLPTLCIMFHITASYIYMQKHIHTLFALQEFIFHVWGMGKLPVPSSPVPTWFVAFAWSLPGDSEVPPFLHSRLVNHRKAGNSLGFHFLFLPWLFLWEVQGAAYRAADQADIQTRYFDGYVKIAFRVKLLIHRQAKCELLT